MVDHIAIIRAQNQDNYVTEEIEISQENYNAIIELASEMNLTLDEYINYALRLYILNEKFGSENAVFHADLKNMTEKQIEDLFDDLPLYISSDKGDGVCISVEEFNKLKAVL